MMMKNYDKSVEIAHNPNFPQIPDHPYKILITVGSGSGKTNTLLNLTKHHQPDIDKNFVYIDPIESKYQLLIIRREKKIATENVKNTKTFIGFSQAIGDVYENLKCYQCLLI